MEIVNFHVTAIGRISKPAMKPVSDVVRQTAPPAGERRLVYFSATDARDTPVWHRIRLPAGTRIDGPAIIEEKTSTTVLYPGQRAEVDAFLNLEVEPANTW